MPLHPGEEDQVWLTEELSAVLSRLGTELFLSGPILEPTSRFFPDAFETDAGAVRVVARRLLHWTGRSLEIEVDLDHAPDPARHINVWRLYALPVREGKLLIEVEEVGRSDHLAGVMAHVVARAVRSDEGTDKIAGAPYRGGGEQNEEALELELATLTTVALGMGALALSAAERHHTGGGIEGNFHSFEVATERHGALPMPDLAFLLAVQLVVRDYTLKGARQLATHVPPNAQKLLLDWFAELTPSRNALIAQLGLPDPATWPPAKSPEAPVPFPLEAASDLAHPERDKINWRRPVFRVSENRAVPYGIGAGLIGVVAAGFLRLPPIVLVGLTTGTAAAGYLAGRRVRRDVCSDPGCGRLIEVGDERCDGCGGLVAGQIGRASDRLEAEEKLPASFFSDHDLDPPGRAD